MTVYRPKNRRTFEYDFRLGGRRYRDTTGQTRKDQAARVEAKLKEKLRQRAAGIYIPQREDSPTFQSWFGVFLTFKEKTIARPDALANIIPVALRFWGDPADVEPSPAAPCHGLHLCDPITDPEWILKWEAWLEARGLSNGSKNHYRGLLRRAYAVAMLPQFRGSTGVQFNPFAGVPNDPTMPRDVTMTKTQIRTWLKHAPYHVRLAVAVGALAHKLRLRNVLELEWAMNFDPDPRTTKFSPRTEHYITIRQHKTARRTKRPMVVPVSQQLLRILKDAWQRQPMAERVVTYRGQSIKGIADAVKSSIEAAGLPYGRDLRDGKENLIGITFHTLRHSVTTMLSDMLADPMQLMDAAGHGDFATTLKYRHKRPRHERPAVERFSRALKIEDLVTAGPARRRKPATRKAS